MVQRPPRAWRWGRATTVGFLKRLQQRREYKQTGWRRTRGDAHGPHHFLVIWFVRQCPFNPSNPCPNRYGVPAVTDLSAMSASWKAARASHNNWENGLDGLNGQQTDESAPVIGCPVEANRADVRRFRIDVG
jgi:hypothetical protein